MLINSQRLTTRCCHYLSKQMDAITLQEREPYSRLFRFSLTWTSEMPIVFSGPKYSIYNPVPYQSSCYYYLIILIAGQRLFSCAVLHTAYSTNHPLCSLLVNNISWSPAWLLQGKALYALLQSIRRLFTISICLLKLRPIRQPPIAFCYIIIHVIRLLCSYMWSTYVGPPPSSAQRSPHLNVYGNINPENQPPHRWES